MEIKEEVFNGDVETSVWNNHLKSLDRNDDWTVSIRPMDCVSDVRDWLLTYEKIYTQIVHFKNGGVHVCRVL